MTERAIDKVIREAIGRGEFDNLPGAGKPLDLSDADDPDWWIKRLIKREQLDLSGGLPAVFGLRRERESCIAAPARAGRSCGTGQSPRPAAGELL